MRLGNSSDEALLSTPDAEWSLVDVALARGDLDQAYGGARGSQYIAKLHMFLARNGYG
jgi:hypothetical protein